MMDWMIFQRYSLWSKTHQCPRNPFEYKPSRIAGNKSHSSRSPLQGPRTIVAMKMSALCQFQQVSVVKLNGNWYSTDRRTVVS